MATQPPTPPPRNGNGRESLALSIGGRSFGVQARDLLSVLLLVAGCVGGYLIFIALNDRITTILERQERTQTLIQGNKDAVIEALHVMQAFLTDQVTASQQRILGRDQAAQQRGQEALEVIQRMLRVHEHNAYQEPNQRLPLDIPLESLGKPLQPQGSR